MAKSPKTRHKSTHKKKDDAPTINVTIKGARGLPYEPNELQKMYCICDIEVGGKEYSFQTYNALYTDKVEWNFKQKRCEGFTPGVQLSFEIYDETNGPDDAVFIGKSVLNAEEYCFAIGFCGELEIEDLEEPAEAWLDVEIDVHGHVAPGVRVHIDQGVCLGGIHPDDVPDDYAVTCIVEVPEKKNSRFKTGPAKGLAPMWKFDQPSIRSYVPGDNITFILYGGDPADEGERGRATLPSKKFWPAGYEGDVMIEGNNEDDQWKITVEVNPWGEGAEPKA